MVSACSMAAAIFLVPEMNSPLDGLMKISSAPLRKAGDHGPVGSPDWQGRQRPGSFKGLQFACFSRIECVGNRWGRSA
jgi:hypothetical protein